MIIPPVQARRRRADRARRLQADPRADPLEARDRRRLPRPDRRERHRRAAHPGARRRHGRETLARDDGRAARLHRAPHAAPSSRRCRTASSRPRASVDNDGYTDEPGAASRPASSSPRRRLASTLTGSDPQRRAPVNSTYAMTFSGVRLRAQVPDRPRPAGQRRLLPPRRRRRAGGHGRRTRRWPSRGRRRLGDARPARRGDLPRAPARVPGPAARGNEGDDVPGGLRQPRRRDGDATRASTTRSPAATAAAPRSDGPDAVQAHGQNTENAPIEETELNYPVRIPQLALVENSEGPGRFRGGLGLRKDYLFDRATTFTILADRDRFGPWGAFGGHDARRRRVRPDPRRRRDAPRLEGDGRARAGRRDQRAHVRRRRLRPARGARAGRGAPRRARRAR